VLLQFLYDLSDREMEEQATFNLACKWFRGLSTEELPPDFSTLCRFRPRLGAEGFETLFNQVVEQARSRGASLPIASTSSTPPLSAPGGPVSLEKRA
jgi:IS5 family transposase